MFFFQCLSHDMLVMSRFREFSPLKQFSDTPADGSMVHFLLSASKIKVPKPQRLPFLLMSLLCYTGTFSCSRAHGKKGHRSTHV